ncbi:MAG TPA: hypothetical protein VJT72_07845 [Pseudonocardiaceae bacterium]|nr:hypothetical protein [Pseudonocardiaceae bacterium]
MPTDRKFDLGDYVEVKDRIRIFYEQYPDGRLVTGKVYTEMGPDGTPRVVVKAKAYRTADDPHPGKGSSWMELPGKTTYTRGSELENTETSAWGRAIASLGILVDKSIASAQEVDNKRGDYETKVTTGVTPKSYASFTPPDVHDQGGVIGVIEESKDSPDFLPHATPDGYVITFKLKGDRGGIKVVATSPLAEQLADLGRDAVIGQRVSCWGRIKDESYTTKANRKVTYQVLELERITGAFGALPLTEPPIAPGQEPMFSDEEQAALDAAIASVPIEEPDAV